MSLITAGGTLLPLPSSEQHIEGHNEKRKYNSAYSIGFVCYLPASYDVLDEMLGCDAMCYMI